MVESVQNTFLLMGRLSSLVTTAAIRAPVNAATSSRRGMDGALIGVTRAFPSTKATLVEPSILVVLR